jgi:radical SAM superfamily enzyme YgiQ (UPF0313 family)
VISAFAGRRPGRRLRLVVDERRRRENGNCRPVPAGTKTDPDSSPEAHAWRQLHIEMNAVTDNPLIFPPPLKDGESLAEYRARLTLEECRAAVLSGGNFHGEPVGLAMDYVEQGERELAALLSPVAAEFLEPMAQRAQAITRRHFGRTLKRYTPLYLSNECVNNCTYCGFSRDNPILRVTLSVDEVVREARALAGQGFRNVLLVAGEHPKFISGRYMADCVEALRDAVPSISLILDTQG